MPADVLTRPDGPDRSTTHERGAVSHRAGFWITAYAFTVTMAFSAVPTPLYVNYQDRDHFSAATSTVVFAVYAIGVVVSLLLVGHVSDRLGRRRVLVPAVLVSVLAGFVFLFWPTLPGLLLARVLSGLAVGAITATATVHLAELHRVARSGADRRRAEIVATAANLGGIGLGPLASGILADVGADPLQLPYVVFGVLLVVAAIGLSLVPETAPLLADAGRYRPQRVTVPPSARGLFYAAALGAFAALAVFGLFTSLAPALLTGMLGRPSHALTGAVAFATFAAGATVQMLLARRSPRVTMPAGAAAVTAGLVLVAVSVSGTSLVGFVAGGVIAGGGAGLIFAASVAVVAGLDGGYGRAEVLAGVFLAGYVGLAVPVLGLGLATRFLAQDAALTAFVVLVVAVTIAAAVTVLARIRNAPERSSSRPELNSA